MSVKIFNIDGTRIDIPTELSELKGDSTHRTVTDAEKAIWNSKQDKISDLGKIRSGARNGAKSVSYEEQTLNEEQKAQARANIGAASSNFSVSFNNLTDKPEIPTVTNLVKNGSPEAVSSGGVYNAIASAITTALNTPV